jgi:subtilisin family serine protease
VSIAVVDSGIDGTHPMFDEGGTSKVVRNLKLACPYLNECAGEVGEPRNEAFVDVTALGNDSDTLSIGGHGTHVAAIAAGVDVVTGDGRELYGAAPGAKLVGLSVGQTLSMYGGAAGLNWVLEHHAAPCGNDADPAACPPIRVVNNSWGALGGSEYSAGSVISKIQDALVADGVVVVWAAGNDGGDGSDNRTNGPGASPTPGVLMVANYDDGGTGSRDNGLNSSSSRGERGRVSTYPDLSAPGTAITAACRPQLAICQSLESDQDYGTIGGTSMAAPHVAGAVAVLMEADPTLSPGQIEYILETTAHKFAGGGSYEPDLPERNPDSRTSFDKGHGLLDMAAALGAVLDVGVEPPVQDCVPDGPVVVDATGDANRFIFDTPLPSESSLDIVEGRLDWDTDEGAVTFTIQVADLTEDNPPGTTGIAFDFNFDHAGGGYYVLASRSTVEEPSFVLGRLATTRETLVSGLPGRFDTETDTITITVPNSLLGDTIVPQFADGDVLGGFSIVSRRQFNAVAVSFIPDADDAGGICPYTLGLGAVPPPEGDPVDEEPPSSGGDADATLGVGDNHRWEGGPVTDSHFLFGCSGISGRTCHDEHIELLVPAGGATIGIDLEADLGALNDYDLELYGPDGTIVATSATEGSNESISERVTVPGVYRVRVIAWLTVESGFRATATLTG